MRKQACSGLCLEIAKSGFELRSAGSKPVCSLCSAALCACQQVVPYPHSSSLLSTQNTEAYSNTQARPWGKGAPPPLGLTAPYPSGQVRPQVQLVTCPLPRQHAEKPRRVSTQKNATCAGHSLSCAPEMALRVATVQVECSWPPSLAAQSP